MIVRHDFRGCPFSENRISKGSEGLVSLLTDSDDNQQQNKYVEGAVISTLDASASLAISTIRGKYAPYMIGQSAFAIDVKHRFE